MHNIFFIIDDNTYQLHRRQPDPNKLIPRLCPTDIR